MDRLRQDIRHALRSLARAPGFTAVALITLALGIGGNAAIFAVVDAVLLRPLPFPDPGRLVIVWPEQWHSPAEFTRVRERTSSFADLGAWSSAQSFVLSGAGDAERIDGVRTTARLFRTLGAPAALGRTFADEEERPGGDRVVLLSDGLWRRRFGADPSVVGRAITLDGAERIVVGVMSAEFDFPTKTAQLWVPVALDEAQPGPFWGTVGYRVVGRLRPGASMAAASAEVRQVAPPIRLENPLWTPGEDYGRNASVTPLQSELSAGVERTLFILLAAVGAVLLIACANIANLLLARATARGREVAIRTALGATRGRVIRQLLTESIVLSLAGGILGLALAAVGVRVLAWRLPPDTPRIAHVSIDPRVLAFTAFVAIAAGVLFGLAPALRTVATDLRGALTDGQRGTTSRGTTRLSGLFVAGEMALAVVLVISAGLLLRSFWRLSQVDPGVRIAEVMTARISPPASGFDADRRRLLFESVLERARALPGVNTAALIGEPPFIGGPDLMATRVAEHPDYGTLNGGPLPMAHHHIVTPDYLAGLGIPLRRGRLITEADRAGSPRAVLVNETFAREMWPGEDPVGKRIGYPWQSEWLTVVGVVADVRHAGLDSGEELEYYEPLAQVPPNVAGSANGAMTLVLRMAGSSGTMATGAMAEQVRGLVASIDPSVAVSDVRPMRDLLAMSVDAPRTTMFLLLAFAVVALALGAVGIYGTIAYWVGQRLHEMGLRLALGARRGDILRLVVAQGMTFAVAGLAVGLIAAFAGTRVLAGLLFGVSPTDLVTFVAVPLFLAIVAAAASAIPAFRAARVDPMRAMGRG